MTLQDDQMLEKKIDDLRRDMNQDIAEIRADVESKHRDNRADIHKFRDSLQLMVNQVTMIIGLPGHPGPFYKLLADVEKIKEEQIAQTAEMKGQKAATAVQQESVDKGWQRVNTYLAAITVIVLVVGAVIAYFQFRKGLG